MLPMKKLKPLENQYIGIPFEMVKTIFFVFKLCC